MANDRESSHLGSIAHSVSAAQCSCAATRVVWEKAGTDRVEGLEVCEALRFGTWNDGFTVVKAT